MIKSREEALAVLAEIERISQMGGPPKFYDPSFKAQKDFILDDSDRVAALCTRRAGKSYGVGYKMYRAALSEPGCSIIYLGLTRMTAKRIMWKDVMKPLNEKLHLNCIFHETELSIRLPNGSVIYIAGADGIQELEKHLGGKLKLAVIDEAGSFRIDLKSLCYEMLEPALADYDGTLCMIGTPTALLDTLFHKVTTGREPGWKCHSWTTFDNPHMASVWRKRLEKLKEHNPNIEETPAYRRMYLKEWVTDLSSLVYKYEPARNLVPDCPKGQMTYVMGIDLGYEDPTAFVICGFLQTDKTLYVIESHKAKHMVISDVATRAEYYCKKYDINRIIVDNASKQAVEELRQRYGLQMLAADKVGKAEFIEIMNAEILSGRIKIVDSDSTLPLRDEWGSLVWDERSKKREEHPACDNHCADAALYAWRECYQYLSQPPVEDKRSIDEKMDDYEIELAEKLDKEMNMPFWERDWI